MSEASANKYIGITRTEGKNKKERLIKMLVDFLGKRKNKFPARAEAQLSIPVASTFQLAFLVYVTTPYSVDTSYFSVNFFFSFLKNYVE